MNALQHDITMAQVEPNLHVLLFCRLEESEDVYQNALDSILESIHSGHSTLKDVVSSMSHELTTTHDAIRYRGALLLAEVAARVPSKDGGAGGLSLNDLHHLTEFFANRFSDFACLRCYLKGAHALLTRFFPGGPEPLSLPSEDAATIARAYVEHLHLPGLSQPDRHLGLGILGALIRHHGLSLAVPGGVDLPEAAISSMDGEKDPRCLLEGFEAVRALGGAYGPGSTGASICGSEAIEELFEVLTCYFPIAFTPPPGDQRRITRASLAEALQGAMLALPQFMPLLVPLALEKLASTLRYAKEDSLALLAAAAASPSSDAAAIEPHLEDLWAALRAELLAPGIPGLSDVDRDEKYKVAELAAGCLRALAGRADRVGSGMVRLVLSDARIGGAASEGLQATAGQGVFTHDPPERVKHVSKAWAGVLSALASASPTSCKAVGQEGLGRLCDLADHCRADGGAQPGTASETALMRSLDAIATVLRAAAALPSASGEHPLSDFAPRLPSSILGTESAAAATPSLEEAQAAALDALAAVPTLLPAGPAGDERLVKHLLAAARIKASGPEGAMEVDEAEPAPRPSGPTAAALSLAGVVRSLVAHPRGSQVVLRGLVRPLLGEQFSEGGRPTDLGLLLVEVAASSGRQAGSGGAQSPPANSQIKSEVLGHVATLFEDASPASLLAAERLGAPLVGSVLSPSTAALEDSPEAVARLARAVVVGAEGLDAQAEAQGSTTGDAGPGLADRLGTYIAIAGACMRRLPPRPHQLPALDRSVQALAEALSEGPPRAYRGAVAAVVASFAQPEALDVAGGTAEAVLQGAARTGTAPGAPADTARAIGSFLGSLAARSGATKGPVSDRVASATASVANTISVLVSTIERQPPPILIEVEMQDSDTADPAPSPTPDEAVRQLATSIHVAAALIRGGAMVGSVAGLALETLLHTVVGSPRLNSLAASGDSPAARALLVGAGALASSLVDLPLFGMTSDTHCKPRLIWKQRHATSLLKDLEGILGSLAQDGGRMGPLLAISAVLAAAPAATLSLDGPRLIPHLADLIRALGTPTDLGDDYAALHTAVLTLASIAAEPTGRAAVESGALSTTLEAFLTALDCGGSAAVRCTALRGLVALMELPYHKLHPHRPRVLKAVTRATDDLKRSVRVEAIQCRQVWSSI